MDPFLGMELALRKEGVRMPPPRRQLTEGAVSGTQAKQAAPDWRAGLGVAKEVWVSFLLCTHLSVESYLMHRQTVASFLSSSILSTLISHVLLSLS